VHLEVNPGAQSGQDAWSVTLKECFEDNHGGGLQQVAFVVGT
jgi:hypothetical protein